MTSMRVTATLSTTTSPEPGPEVKSGRWAARRDWVCQRAREQWRQPAAREIRVRDIE